MGCPEGPGWNTSFIEKGDGKMIGIGLIGCGSMGMGLGRALKSLEMARISAVCDENPDALLKASEEFGAKPYRSYEDLLGDGSVDACVVATPQFAHERICVAAANAGKHAFCEKPMALNVGECDRMIEAFKRSGKKLMIGQVLRFYPAFSKIKELVESGLVGKPFAISVTRIGGGWGEWARGWRGKMELCGGLLMEINSHEIDFMCWICGEPKTVYARMGRFVQKGQDYPDTCFVTISFEEGAFGFLHSSNASAIGDLSGKIQGEEGTIFWQDGFSPNGTIRYARISGESGTIRIGEIGGEDPVRKELRLFLESIIEDKPSPIPGEEGRRAVAVAQAAYISNEEGRPVEVEGR
jgi:predicted dehydrogenase